MFHRRATLILSLVLLLLAAATLAACGDAGDTDDSASADGSTTVDDDLAPWLKQLIAGIEAEPAWNPPAKITSYEYHGKKVYFVPSDCCDKLSTLYDADGKVICSPDGGIGGAGDGRCPDFFEMTTDQRVIWEDSRS